MKKLFRASRTAAGAGDGPAPDVGGGAGVAGGVGVGVGGAGGTGVAGGTAGPGGGSGAGAGYASPPPPPGGLARDLLPHAPSKKSLASLIEDHSRKRAQNSVTPFPPTVGQAPPPPPQQQQQQQYAPAHPYSANAYPGAQPVPHGRARAPTMQEARPDPYAANDWSVPPPPPPTHHRLSNGADASPNSAGAFYLPPGARPADPIAMRQDGREREARPMTPPLRDARDAREPRARARDSQTSLSAGHGLDDVYGGYRSGRSRGYSSASHGSQTQSRGSDHEGAGSVPKAAGHLASPPVPPKAGKSPIPSRSPLAYEPAAYPVPPAAMPGSIYHSPAPAPAQPVAAPWGAGDADDAPKEKERRRFWWDRRKGGGVAADEDTPRQSMDELRDDSVTGHESRSTHGGHGGYSGHGAFGAAFGTGTIGGVGVEDGARDVTTAIRFLCAAADPPIDQIYRICDGVNHSDTPESVGKEAARCLRKELKAGGDAQRRIAARTWLVMMQNVGTKGFRQHASSKKFLGVLEPLITGPTRTQASPATRRLLIDIVGHLAYHFGADKGCEALVDTWRKVKMAQDPDSGVELPADHPVYSTTLMSPMPLTHYPFTVSPPNSRDVSRPPSQPTGTHLRAASPNPYGPPYTHLPDHNDDMRRLVDECNSAKETARLLHEALVFTKPEELEYKPVIREFYQKCFGAHDSLTAAMAWAQSEAARSRQRYEVDGARNGGAGETQTAEERALALLFDAHHSLAEVLRQHDDLENLAREQREMREVQERSKTETRMDRNHAYEHNGLAPPGGAVASSSRTPSPVHAPLPLPRTVLSSSPGSLPIPVPQPRPGRAVADRAIARSRTPSPDAHQRPSASPSRNGSPLGLGRLRMGPRPLPNPFRPAATTNGAANGTVSVPGSTPATGRSTPAPANGGQAPPVGQPQGALGIHVPPTDYARSVPSAPPSRGGSGSTTGTHDSAPGAAANGDDDSDDEPAPRARPSRKALGKRRALVEDADNPFDPNDIFGLPKPDPPPAPKSANDDDDDDSYSLHRPAVQYAYDAYQEKLEREAREAAGRAAQGGSRRAADAG